MVVDNIPDTQIDEELQDDPGFCRVCYLRIWERTSFTHGLEKHHAEGFVRDGGATKHQKTNPCILCLGLLSPSVLAECLSSIRALLGSEKFKNENHVSKKACAVSLSVPPALFVRERSVKIFLCEKYEGLLDLNRRSPFITLKEAWKMSLSLLCGNEQVFDDNCPLIITVNVTYEQNIDECSKLLSTNRHLFPNVNKKNTSLDEIFSRKSVLSAVELSSDAALRALVPVPPTVPSSSVNLEVTANHLPVYVAGRYNKYSRQLSQTPWVIGGDRKTETSVEELICDSVRPSFKASSHNFSSSGREDVDVRMLGDGRPFVIELIDAGMNELSFSRFRELENEINKDGRVKVRDMQVVSKEEVKKLKTGEEDKKKTYTALCISKAVPKRELVDALEASAAVTLDQKTPIRVLHRRPLAVRKRTVEDFKFRQLDRKQGDFHLFSLTLTTQAGTYVKEFVHGDFGRTVPNLSSMLDLDIDIIALDVEKIDLEWPSPVME